MVESNNTSSMYQEGKEKKKNFIERLTDEQIQTFLKNYFSTAECSYIKIDNNRCIRVFRRIHSRRIVCFDLKEFISYGISPEEWINYLYKVFGEEYKQAYLARCEKIFK